MIVDLGFRVSDLHFKSLWFRVQGLEFGVAVRVYGLSSGFWF